MYRGTTPTVTLTVDGMDRDRRPGQKQRLFVQADGDHYAGAKQCPGHYGKQPVYVARLVHADPRCGHR